MGKNINIKMGRYEVNTPPVVLTAIGIGSCVAVCLYHNHKNTGGLAHVMLPAKEGKNSMKRADNLIESLVTDMKNKGITNQDIEAKIFGGASLFDHATNIGERNVESVKKELSKRDIDIIAEDTGGDKGRSVWLDTKNGSVVVSQVKGPTKRF